MRRRACRRHRRALLALAVAEVRPAGCDPAGHASSDPAAQAHLERCTRCRLDAERDQLVAYHLWREFAATRRRAELSERRGDPWPAVRARIARHPPRSRWTALMTLGGSLAPGLAAGLLFAVLGNPAPLALHDGSAHAGPAHHGSARERSAYEGAASDGSTTTPAHVREAARVERRYDPARVVPRGGTGDPEAVTRSARDDSGPVLTAEVDLDRLVTRR